MSNISSLWFKRTSLVFQRLLAPPSHRTRKSWLAALALASAASPGASATTFVDDFSGSGGVPAGWINFGPDLSGPVVVGGGVVSLTDGRANSPHLLQYATSLSASTAFTLTLDLASVTSFTDSNGAVSQPQAIAAVGSFNGYALVVQFNAVTKKMTAFVNGPAQGQFVFPGDIPAYAGGAMKIIVQADNDHFRITSPTYGYDSGVLLYSSAGVAGFNTLPDLGTSTGLLIGTESAGNTLEGTFATIAYNRVELNTTPVVAPPPVSGNSFADHFTGNSNGVPAGWTDIGQDTNPASTIVESGSVVTITDTRSNGGPQFMQSNASIGSVTGFSMKADIAAMTSFSGSQPQAILALGKVPNLSSPPFTQYVFMVMFDGVAKTFKVQIIGPTMGAYAVPGTVASYAGGALSLEVRGTATGFRILSATHGFDSLEIPYTAVVATGFSPADLGSTPAFVIGTESSGSVNTGTPASVAYDRVELIATPAVVNQAPVANAGADQSIHAGSIVALDGSTSFDDNTTSAALGYAWAFTSKPAGSVAVLNNASTATPGFVADKTGDYVLQLIVTDAQGLTSVADTVSISSNNLAPTAEASADFNLAVVGTTVHFSAAGSTDPESDTLVYAWSILAAPAGSTATLAGATTATPTLTVDKEGTFKVALTVSDPFGPGTPVTVEVVATQPASNPEVQIIYASDVVEVLPLSKVTTKGNKEAFTNFLKQATKQLQKGDVAGAISKLKEAIERTDGCALRGAVDGNGANRDWITDRNVQLDVYALLAAAVSALSH